jgi:hypothetical protein
MDGISTIDFVAKKSVFLMRHFDLFNHTPVWSVLCCNNGQPYATSVTEAGI